MVYLAILPSSPLKELVWPGFFFFFSPQGLVKAVDESSPLHPEHQSKQGEETLSSPSGLKTPVFNSAKGLSGKGNVLMAVGGQRVNKKGCV